MGLCLCLFPECYDIPGATNETKKELIHIYISVNKFDRAVQLYFDVKPLWFNVNKQLPTHQDIVSAKDCALLVEFLYDKMKQVQVLNKHTQRGFGTLLAQISEFLSIDLPPTFPRQRIAAEVERARQGFEQYTRQQEEERLKQEQERCLVDARWKKQEADARRRHWNETRALRLYERKKEREAKEKRETKTEAISIQKELAQQTEYLRLCAEAVETERQEQQEQRRIAAIHQQETQQSLDNIRRQLCRFY